MKLLRMQTWPETSGIRRVPDSYNDSLVQVFYEEEVWGITKGLPGDSAPGPDGFPTIFYKTFWGIMKQHFMKMVKEFFEGKLDLKRLNYGVVTLIPKIKDANTIKHFRPICLINVSFKIITKLLAVCLGKIANMIIKECQTAFIKRRNILDRVISLHEILHDLRETKKSGIAHFENAYDKV